MTFFILIREKNLMYNVILHNKGILNMNINF